MSRIDPLEPSHRDLATDPMHQVFLPRLSDARYMRFDEFARTVADFPAHERWELVEGYAVMMTPPGYRHQQIVDNLHSVLLREWARLQPAWEPMRGLGVALASDREHAAIPDLMIGFPPEDAAEGWITNPLAVFEVLSPTTRGNDRGWKRSFYARIPSCRHYVLVHQNRRRVELATRETGFALKPVETEALTLAGLDVVIPVDDVYARTGLG